MRGIAIIGLNGGGKSTLSHGLAKKINYIEIDLEDCYFPEQSQSRKWALDHNTILETKHLGALPFSKPRSKDAVENLLMEKINDYPNFVISSVSMNWYKHILASIDMIFWVQTPLEERLKRIQHREQRRFGSRVLEGGDMYQQQLDFLEVVAHKESISLEENVLKVDCPVIQIDGTLPISQNIDYMVSCIGK